MRVPVKALITGGAGFIGSNLADNLHSHGTEVVVFDNFTTGRRRFIDGLIGKPRFELVEGDVHDTDLLSTAMAGCDWIFHLQANADVRWGTDHPTRDLEQNTVATSCVLEAMRRAQVTRILFSSTGSVYGEPNVFPTPEDAPFPVQTSLYGASKLAGEGLLSAYAAGFGFVGIICRFVSIVGERYTHGHIIDFYRSLRRDPSRLSVLGNGRQEKSYLYVKDCARAMLSTVDRHQDEPGTHIYNLGTDETLVVDDSVAIITEYLGLQPDVTHTGGERGWVGDSPLIRLDTTRIRSLGWAPQLTIRDSVLRTLEWFEGNSYAWDTDPAATRPV
jgi:UDP-glucose 4-epimerase